MPPPGCNPPPALTVAAAALYNNLLMDTAFGLSAPAPAVKTKVRQFYDVGSPYYLRLWGEHFHDGYYLTGKESKVEAQVELIKRLAEKAGIRDGTTVLDIGCGTGGSSLWLAEHLKAVTTGITISPVQVETARELARQRGLSSSFELMDAEEMRFDGSFDVIWMVASLTHLREQTDVLSQATAFLNRGGRFVLFDWMSGKGVSGPGDAEIDTISKGMLLASLQPMSFYIEWFGTHGYRIAYSEDMTAHTIKTWDDAMARMKHPGVWKLALSALRRQQTDIFAFVKSIRPMKHAMQQGKLISGAVIAEKIESRT